jgi:hypothetical protein
MKTRFFFAAMAALAIISCNKEADVVTPTLEGPAAMLKVNIKSAAQTKAYSDGIAEENVVKTVDFYFYDAAGAAYSVVPGSNSIKWTAQDPANDNIAAVSDVVLVIKQAEQTPPAKVVAILNDATDYSGLTLEQLGKQVITALHTGKTNFVMSNSVYYDEAKNKTVVVASDITQDNIFVDTKYEGEAGATYTGDVAVTPIDIYVERVAAKVTVNFGAENLVPVKDAQGNQMKDSEGKAVYVDFTGWNVTNATNEANLIKSLNASYDFAWTWNNPADFRSFWANTTDTPEHKHTFTALEAHTDAFDYYFENTSAEASQLLVAARLCDAEGAKISLAKWYNVLYTVADAKLAVVNTIATKVYVAGTESGTYVSVGVDDVVFYQREYTAADNRYEVLVAAKEGVTYYKADGTVYTDVAEVFEAILPIQMWEEGMTYYYTTINHIDAAAPAIVRNHEYQITVSGVKGFGTPVYDPDQIIIPEPVDPQDALNLAAQINVLSWNVVSQDVTLGF